MDSIVAPYEAVEAAYRVSAGTGGFGLTAAWFNCGHRGNQPQLRENVRTADIAAMNDEAAAA
jgi:hypothetical protein